MVKTLLSTPGIHPEHLVAFLNNALWQLTDAESVHKHETRLQSRAAYTACRKTIKRRHDHVFQRAVMVEELIAAGKSADWTQVDAILAEAVACTVTLEEHLRLRDFDHLDGWDRYKAAGITVIDTETNTELNFD